MKINYAAIVVSAVVYWLLGALWYGVLFNKPWMALEHMSLEQAKSMNPILPYVITFVLNLLVAYVLALVCNWRNANTASRGGSLGILLWLGFIGPVTYTNYMFEMRSMHLFAINEFYSLFGLFLMGLIIGGWTKKAA